jgi:hypothetical protein
MNPASSTIIGVHEDHTLEEVSQQFSVTRERIRQIEAKALRKLKHPSRSRALRSFLAKRLLVSRGKLVALLTCEWDSTRRCPGEPASARGELCRRAFA